MGRRLHVGNLPYSSGEDNFRNLFGGAGNVVSVNIPTDMAAGRPRGFAFIEMSSNQEAMAAIEKFNQFDLEGRRLTVNEARPKTRPVDHEPNFGGGQREPRW